LLHTNLGYRAFSAALSRVWNYLPTDLRLLDVSFCIQTVAEDVLIWPVVTKHSYSQRLGNPLTYWRIYLLT